MFPLSLGESVIQISFFCIFLPLPLLNYTEDPSSITSCKRILRLEKCFKAILVIQYGLEVSDGVCVFKRTLLASIDNSVRLAMLVRERKDSIILHVETKYNIGILNFFFIYEQPKFSDRFFEKSIANF